MPNITIVDFDRTEFDSTALDSTIESIDITHTGITDLLVNGVWPNVVILKIPNKCSYNQANFPNVVYLNGLLFK
jgi:hypothetical protein